MSLKTGFIKFWDDPVWSKVIAAGIIAGMSFLFIKISERVFSISTRTAIIILVVVIIFIVILYLILRLSKTKPEKIFSQKQPTSSATSDIPFPGNIPKEHLLKIQTADSIEMLRQNTGVRPLIREENQLTLRELPDGVFGYIEAFIFNTPQMRVIIRSNIEIMFDLNKGLHLCQNPMSNGYAEMSNGYAEIHKSQNGNIYLICFVTEEDRILLQNPSRFESVKLTVSLTKTQKRNRVIAIPRERLEYWRQRRLSDGEYVGDARIS